MTVKPFQTLVEFLADNPLRNHSSRVLSKLPPAIGIAVSVADAFLRDVAGVISASVADATIQDVPTGPLIGLGATTLTYASTAIGSSLDMTVIITNNGSADLVVSSLTPSGDFSVASVTA